jgi:TolB protein
MTKSRSQAVDQRSFHRSVLALGLPAVLAWERAGQADPPKRPVQAFFELRADGSSFRRLFEMAEFYPCHSPRISPDGRSIAFDGWKSREGDGLTDARVLVCKLDGSGLVEVCRGSMPSWSPDGKRFACSRYGEHQGVWITDVDGANQRCVDRAGWGIQWSPVGDAVAYTRGKQIVIRDLANETERVLFPADGGPFRSILWNMTWSGDGRRLAFIGETERGRELAIIDVQGAELGFQKRLAGAFNPMLSWSPDATRLVFPEKIQGGIQLSEIDPANSEQARRIRGIPAGQKVASGSWHPDGQRLIVLGLES